MGSSSNPLAAQRWLTAGLLAVFSLAAYLTWTLRSGAERARGPADTRVPIEHAGGALAPVTAASPEPGGRAGASAERAALGGDAAPIEAGASFDPAAVYGRVVARGAPVAGVELRLFDGALERRERVTPLALARSEADGRFRFRERTPHVRYALHLQHEDFLPAEETVFPGHEEELELEPAAAVAGIVRSGASGQPLAGVEVALERWCFAADGPHERASAVSGPDGRWRLGWARPGIERFLVLRPGFVGEEREFQVGAAGGEGFEIWLDEVPALELEVYALESGAALADTELLLDERSARTDARGHLSVPRRRGAPEDESVRLALALPGGCLTQGRIVPARVQAPRRVPVARGGTVHGRVLDAAGAGVAGALVRLGGGGRVPADLGLPEGFWLNPPRAGVRSALDGAFELTGLPPRENPVEVRAQHPEHPAGRSAPFGFLQLGARAQADVVLEAGAALAGTVRLDGAPAPLRVFWSAERGGGWTRADDRGAYALAGLPAGEISVRARLDDEDEDVPRPEDRVLALADGERATLDLELVSQRALIRGRVLDTRGLPVAEAEIVAWPQNEQDWQGDTPRTETTADGLFELSVPDTPGLAFTVTAESGPRRAEVEDVLAGAERIELVLSELAEVVLHVRDALTREHVPTFQLYWRESEDGEFARLDQGGRRLSPGADGGFVAELPAARLDLCVTARPLGYAPALQAGLELGLGGTVEFELERGVELELEVRVAEDAAGALRQLQRGRVAIASAEQWDERARGGDYFQQEVRNAQALRVDEAGVARITALASGRYRFVNVPRGLRFRPETFELPAVAAQRVTVALEAEPRREGE